MQEYLLPGTFLQGNRYRIVRFIASGGFGCTYEGVHILLDKRVAIKEFFVKDFCNRDETNGHVTLGTLSRKPLVDKLRQKFIREAKGLCEFNHPGIVNVFDIFEENGTAYFVMDYIDGASLKEIVDKNGAMPEDKALGYIRQVAEALRQVHAKHRLHLDIKPANIMIGKDKRAVLIDFGASKQYNGEDGQNNSTLLGYSRGYASPEQRSNAVQYFHACTDLYALGATLYKLVTGKTPPDSMIVLSEGELEIPDHVSPAVANAIKRSMHPVRKMRPQSVDEFLALLDTSSAPEQSGEEATVIYATAEKPEHETTTNIKSRTQTVSVSKPVSDREKSGDAASLKKKKRKGYLLGVLCGLGLVLVTALVIWFVNSLRRLPPEETVEKIESVNEQRYTNMAGESFIYTGAVEDNLPNDKNGKGVYSDGTYEGEYVRGERQGYGVFTMNDGTKMTGQFVKDKISVGKAQFKDNSSYTGSWDANGKFLDGTLIDKNDTCVYINGKGNRTAEHAKPKVKEQTRTKVAKTSPKHKSSKSKEKQTNYDFSDKKMPESKPKEKTLPAREQPER